MNPEKSHKDLYGSELPIFQRTTSYIIQEKVYKVKSPRTYNICTYFCIISTD